MGKTENKFDPQQHCWFAARTRCGAELSVAGRLDRLGVERFVPTETRLHTRGGAAYERALIPCLVFLKTTKQDACALANEQSLPVRYLIDPATRSLLVVPDKQMDDFRRVLDLSTDEGGLVGRPLELGERVRVIKGVLAGVEGHVLELRGKVYVVVQLLDSWFAKASVPRAWLEPIGNKRNTK
ncbi:MAG: UpxY family transcription antiterminator [Bacteroidales bacterium]|nr:UpxY family transcription antiterminator [Bacteroidales bacterium]